MQEGTSARDQLLHHLLTHPSYTPGSDLAGLLGLSTKSVYRIVREINDHHVEGPVIESRRGLGYRLDHQAYLHYLSVTAASVQDVTPAERRKRMLRELLDATPHGVSAEELGARHYIGESQVRADLKEIDAALAPYELRVRQRRSKLVVVGPEISIRSALADSLQIDTMGVLSIDARPERPSHALDLAFARGEVEFITTQLGSVLPTPYDINLATHLYVLIARAGEGVSEQGEPLPDADPEHRRVALAVWEHVQSYLGRALPAAEAGHILAYIASSRLEPVSVPAGEREDEATVVVRHLADGMSRRQGVHFGSEDLLTDLVRHVGPMLNRVRFGMYVTNPVLGQIQESYAGLLADLGEVTREVGDWFGLPHVPDDEVGLMCLYFARELELRATQVRAVVACSSGVGTSELLRAKVARFFPEITVVAVVGAARVAATLVSERAIDLVITTVGLPDTVDAPLVVVDAMFSPESQDRVRATLRSLR